MNFRQNILCERSKRGWTQHVAADKLGIKRSCLASYEDGRAFPRLTILKLIVDGYEIKTADLYQFIFGNG
jgi:ribosome-binding protein aMBF1 (putative translation factor)